MSKSPAKGKKGGAAIPAGDASKGQKMFDTQCASCHSISSSTDDANSAAPNLGSVFNRQIAKNSFPYSNAFKKNKFAWDEKQLFNYLKAPGKFIPGNKMAFAGIAGDQDRADLVAYLKTI